ncbi:MAG: trehalose-6-phosphate synthase, partial [Anaerolineae bacterium]|nr:trehalose-6-phosphate synthase [Anaerolineae bacterium]
MNELESENGLKCNGLWEMFFAQRALVIAANRGPVKFFKAEDGQRNFRRGEGGLVTALLGLCRYASASWIASAQTEADADFGNADVQVDAQTKINVHFVPFEEDVYDAYYNVISNPLLWFLQHSMWDVPRVPVIDRATWKAWDEGYVLANQRFAEAIIAQVKANSQPTLVMVQDYQLYLVPHFIRKALKPRERPVILHFVHIPWPGPEYWSILPPRMRTAILESLCAVDLLGFQTEGDALNFMRTCRYHLTGRVGVKYNKGRVWYRNHTTYVRDFPISIDVEALKTAARSHEVMNYRRELE